MRRCVDTRRLSRYIRPMFTTLTAILSFVIELTIFAIPAIISLGVAIYHTDPLARQIVRERMERQS